MLASFPPFPSPNPESVSEPLPPSRDKSSSISPRSSFSLDTMTSSFTSLFPTSKSTTSTSSSSSTTTSSAILPDSALLDDHERGDGGHIIDDSHPSIRSRPRRNSARKCVPPHTRLIKSKRSATQSPPPTSLPTSSMDASTSSLDSTGSGSDDGGHVHFIEDVEVLSGSTESLNGCSGGEKMKSSLRRHSQHAYEDSLRIGGGAWHAKKAVTWAATDDEM